MITTTDTLADFIARLGPPTMTMGHDEVQHHWWSDRYIILAERPDGTRLTSEREHKFCAPAWMSAFD